MLKNVAPDLLTFLAEMKSAFGPMTIDVQETTDE